MTVDLAGVCTGDGPCDTTPLGTAPNWVTKGGGLAAYIRAVAHAVRRKGMSESEAIQLAIGVIRNWAAGKGNVSAATRARAGKALAAWERLKGGSHSHSRQAAGAVDLAIRTPPRRYNPSEFGKPADPNPVRRDVNERIAKQGMGRPSEAALRQHLEDEHGRAGKMAGLSYGDLRRQHVVLHTHSSTEGTVHRSHEHVKGEAFRYKHGWIPLSTEPAANAVDLARHGMRHPKTGRFATSNTPARQAIRGDRMDQKQKVTYPGTSKFPIRSQADFTKAWNLRGASTLPKPAVEKWLRGVAQRFGYTIPGDGN